MERGSRELRSHFGLLMALGLGLLFLNKQDAVDATIEVVKTLNNGISEIIQV